MAHNGRTNYLATRDSMRKAAPKTAPLDLGSAA